MPYGKDTGTQPIICLTRVLDMAKSKKSESVSSLFYRGHLSPSSHLSHQKVHSAKIYNKESCIL